jgi:hypothetical protein
MVSFSGATAEALFFLFTSGFRIRGDVKDMSLINLGNGKKLVLAAVNNDSLCVFSINR